MCHLFDTICQTFVVLCFIVFDTIHQTFAVLCFSLNLDYIFLVIIISLWVLESELFDLECHFF